MPTAHADIRTDRATRYLTQLCRHGTHMGAGFLHRPHRHGDGDSRPEVRTAHCTDSDGVLDFGWGRCTLQATATALLVHAEADDDARLAQIMAGVGERLQRIGRRDQLTVTWSME